MVLRLFLRQHIVPDTPDTLFEKADNTAPQHVLVTVVVGEKCKQNFLNFLAESKPDD